MSHAEADLEQFGGAGRPEVALWGVPGIATTPESWTEEEIAALQKRVHERLFEDNDSTDLAKLDGRRLQEVAEQAAVSVFNAGDQLVPSKVRQRIIADVMSELMGYGPIQEYLEDPTVTEVMVNGPNQIYVERGGRIQATDRVFSDAGHLMRVIERIVAPLGRRVDEASPMVDARLPDGSRVNVIIPPLSVNGPAMTIRKFSKTPLTAQDLVRFGSMTDEMRQFLEAAVHARLNILVSGGTGGGKTTTLNVLSSFIPFDERIVTIEDAAELRLQQDHVVTLESRPSNLEGRGEISIRMLVRNALRMRPDRIIVGEVRGGEALDMLQAMNTGHDGSLSTLHSNSPRDTISRLECMTLMAGMDLPVRAIREQISSALHLLVHQSRLRDGSRRVTHITEVHGLEGDVVVLQDIFRWHQDGVGPDGKIIGCHKAVGLPPRCLDRLAERGEMLPTTIFRPGEKGSNHDRNGDPRAGLSGSLAGGAGSMAAPRAEGGGGGQADGHRRGWWR